jgi:glycerol-3-phosphate dehydrogenase
VSALNINDKSSQLSVVLEGQNQALIIDSKVVVNACGAWSNLLQVNHDKQSDSHKKSSINMRPLRGSHLVVASWRLPVASVISVQHPQDKRPVQIYPWQNVTIVGTTDVEHYDDMAFEAKISQSEFDYLLATIEQQFPSAKITKDDIISTFAGVRPVSTTDNSLTPSKEKRDHHIMQQQSVFTVTGGKLTTFRLIAQQVLNKVCQQLTLQYKANELTLTDALNVASQQPILSQYTGEPLLSTQANSDNKILYSRDILQQILASHGEFSAVFIQTIAKKDCQPIRYSRHLWAELVWSVRFEQVQHLDDLLLRRTRLGNVLPEGARDQIPKIKALCSPYLSWSEEKWQQEISRYLALWQSSYSLPKSEAV